MAFMHTNNHAYLQSGEAPSTAACTWPHPLPHPLGLSKAAVVVVDLPELRNVTQDDTMELAQLLRAQGRVCEEGEGV